VFVQGFAFGTCSPCILLQRCQQSTDLLWKVPILGAVMGFTEGRYFGNLPQRSLKRRSWKDNTSFLVGNMSHLPSNSINMYFHIKRAQSIPVPRRLHECSTDRKVAPQRHSLNQSLKALLPKNLALRISRSILRIWIFFKRSYTQPLGAPFRVKPLQSCLLTKATKN
jgi:hypothetical protein